MRNGPLGFKKCFTKRSYTYINDHIPLFGHVSGIDTTLAVKGCCIMNAMLGEGRGTLGFGGWKPLLKRIVGGWKSALRRIGGGWKPPLLRTADWATQVAVLLVVVMLDRDAGRNECPYGAARRKPVAPWLDRRCQWRHPQPSAGRRRACSARAGPARHFMTVAGQPLDRCKSHRGGQQAMALPAGR